MSGPLSRLSLTTAGESHGPAVIAILEGLPRGLELDIEHVNRELRRRQGGAGRGGRQRIEEDMVDVISGVRRGRTIGSPLCLRLQNRDHRLDEMPEPTRPRPGHADLSGCYRYLDGDIRGTLERASARETVARVAAGAVVSQLLRGVACEVFGFVRSVGRARLPERLPGQIDRSEIGRWIEVRDASRVYTLDDATDQAMLEQVGEAASNKDTAGGVVEVHGLGVLPGAGSCLQWHERLDARMAAAIMSIPAFKGVEIGMGFKAASSPGSKVHDAILPAVDGSGLRRRSNRAGGLEGGMTNGQNLVVRGAMKPISTLRQPLDSVDLVTGEAVQAAYERSDVCAVSAASVIAQAMVALVLGDAVLALVGGETVGEFTTRYEQRLEAARRLGSGT